MTNENTPTGVASVLIAELECFTVDALRRWGEELDRESPRSLGERLLCFADDWRVQIDSLKVDANRYKFLRSSNTSTGTLANVMRNAHSEDRFDAAVDDAMRSNV